MALLEDKDRLILPILDGLDEIPESARPVAITRINRELKPGEQVVVTCRTELYRAAVSPQDGQGAALRAAAVQLGTLHFGQVAAYLRKDAGPAENRWDFLGTLSAKSPARQALVTPLMAGLAWVIYNPRPDERVSSLRDPVELCDFADQAAVQAHLFDAFIPAVYRQPTADRRTVEQAERWLVFLARHLECTVGNSNLAWWQLPMAIRPITFGLVFGLTTGLAAGLVAWVMGGLVAGLVAGLVIGSAGGLLIGNAGGLGSAEAPARGTQLTVRETVSDLFLLVLLLPCILIGLIPVVLALGIAFGVLFGLAFGHAGGIAAGLMAGLAVPLITVSKDNVPGDFAGISSPRAVLARDRLVALGLMLAGAFVGGLIGGLIGGLGVHTGRLTGGLIAGLVGGIVAWWGVSVIKTAWPSYVFAKGWLALRHRLPWRLMNFLADAHKRGILRQEGGVYQFRHIELQHRLANRDADKQQPSSSGAPAAAHE